MNARRAGLLGSLATLVVALVGCSLTQSSQRKEPILPPLGAGGRLVQPRRCVLDVVILTRPQGDPAFDGAIWSGGDEQIVEPELRRALQANGLRVARITGDLPPELEALVRSGPPNQPDVHTIVNPTGDSTLIDPTRGEPLPALNLLLSHPDGKIKGKVYQDAKAFVRLTASFDSGDGVTLRLVPELHHGPVKRGYGVIGNSGALPGPQEFKITSGQQEETFRELAASIDLDEGQYVVLGVRPERKGSLGDVLLQKPEPHSDRILQTLVLIWARRAGSGSSESNMPEPPPALQPLDPKELALGEPSPTPEAAKPGSSPDPADGKLIAP